MQSQFEDFNLVTWDYSDILLDPSISEIVVTQNLTNKVVLRGLPYAPWAIDGTELRDSIEKH